MGYLPSRTVTNPEYPGRDNDATIPLKRMRGIAAESLDLSNWPTVDEGILPAVKLKTFLARKRAVELFLRGSSAKSIQANTGMTKDYTRRLIRQRCVKTHPDGRLFGWRGLVPSEPTRGYVRHRKVKVDIWGKGASGALGATFEICAKENLQARFEAQILKIAKQADRGPNKESLREIKRAKQSLHRWFLGELRKLQFELKREWPFNTEQLGYVTICKYIDKVLNEHPRAKVFHEGGADAVKKMKTGDGADRPPLKPFQRVECDAHKKDGRFIILVPSPDGTYVERLVRRLWVVVILEVVTRAVLGYFLSMRREVNADDVLSAVKCALTEWKKRPISFADNAYHPNAGFPSSTNKEFVGACWDEFSVDGALAETCKRVEDKLETVVGAKIISPYTSFSARRSKDDRPYIESFFRTLEENGLQRLSISTGGKTTDKKGRDPAKSAISARFQLEYAEELLDVLIANYNATPHTSMPNRSPLQALEFQLVSGRLQPRHADPHEVEMLLSRRVLCRVVGGGETGRRPYVNYGNARYSSDILGKRYDLVGQYIWIVQHMEMDARFVLASTEEGVDLGILRAAPPWHRTPHSLFVRRTCIAMARKRLIYLTNNTDPIEQLIAYSESSEAKKLPPHPAYLEARHILTRYAEELEGQSMLEVAKARLAEREADQKQVGRGGSKLNGEMDMSGPDDLRPLPTRRKVVQH